MKFFKFWWSVFLRSKDTVLGLLDIRGHIVVGILILLAYFISSAMFTYGLIQIELVQNIVGDFVSWGTLGLMLVVALILLLFVNFAYQPTRMYDELGGFSELKFRGVVDCPKRVFSEAWSVIHIYNDHPQKSIKNCFGHLISVIDLKDNQELLERPGDKLCWTNGDPPITGKKDIAPLDGTTIDILQTINEQNRIMFVQQGYPDLYRLKPGIGEYKVIVGVSGVFEGKKLEEEIEFIVRYRGGWDREFKPIREVNI